MVRGDVSVPGLGVEPAALAGLDLVIHCAAVTGFGLDPAVYDAVNVQGTANLLACLAEVPLLHVSTAYVCGRRDGPLAEGGDDDGHGFSNGYEASKARAEALVMAGAAQGRTVAAARPSIVVGASGDGAIGAFSGIYGLIRLVAEGRISTLPALPGASLDLVPIDHVVGGLVDIAERMAEAAGRTFHLVSGQPVPVTALAGLAQGFPGLHAPRLVSPADFDTTRLSPTERHLQQQFAAPLAGYLQRDPHFSDANLRALTGRRCPATGLPFLHRLVAHCLSAGYITPRRPRVAA